MRIHFPNLSRPKKAAKTFARLLPDVALAKAQGAVAAACGYRDWHELELCHARELATPDATGPALRQAAVDATLTVAKTLGVGDGPAQYALSASRLLCASDWPFEDHLAVRTACLRRLGELDGYRVVEIDPDWGGVGYLSDRDDTKVYSRRGQPVWSKEAKVTLPDEALPDFVPPRIYLPYGKWTMADDSTVLFSRDYKPMWRLAGGEPERLDSRVWVDGIIEQETFWVPMIDPYKDPARMRAQHERMEAFGIKGLPELVDRMPSFIRGLRVPPPTHYAYGQEGYPFGPPILSLRGPDGGARHRLAGRGYYVTYGGKRPWDEVPRELRTFG